MTFDELKSRNEKAISNIKSFGSLQGIIDASEVTARLSEVFTTKWTPIVTLACGFTRANSETDRCDTKKEAIAMGLEIVKQFFDGLEIKVVGDKPNSGQILSLGSLFE